MRVVIIIGRDGPEILHTVWKIPAGGNIADNFWRSGNMLAAVDAASGEVKRVVRGVGPDQSEVETHPDTGRAIKGLVLPDWERLKALCLDCALIFHKLRYQSWDVAPCPGGPIIVEVNTGAAFNLSQLATSEGFLNERFGRFLREFGFRKLGNEC